MFEWDGLFGWVYRWVGGFYGEEALIDKFLFYVQLYIVR